jgi:pimeloyl-ACP methyl ester carboxylesterase
MKLHYRSIGQGKPIILLHGIFGTSDNWQTFGKALADEGYEVFLVDQRNHGNSPHSNDFSYPVMAEDIREFIRQHQLENPIVLGHSMGGKAALFFAVTYPNLYDKMIVVDIAPKAYPNRHDNIIKAFSAVDLAHLQSRNEAEAQMEPMVADAGVRQFLLKNLKRTDEGFAWKLNLPVIRDNLDKIMEGLPANKTTDKSILFVRGEKSDYINDDDEQAIKEQFPNARIITIPNAGHWVHAEQPEPLYRAVVEFLKNG